MSRSGRDREKRRSALEKMKASKGGSLNRLDEHEFEEEGDVFTSLTEEEYTAVVESRLEYLYSIP
jgi:hypothetical protein